MKKQLVIIAAVLLVIVVGYLILSLVWKRSDPKVAQFIEDADSLILGLQQYREFTGHFPEGSLVDVAKALDGQTTKGEKRVVILVARKSEKNTKGELLDPWGTPIQIYFSQTGILVRSAGPNKIFEDAKAAVTDDLIRAS